MTLRDELWQQDLAKRLAGRPQLAATEYDEALRVVKAAFSALADGEIAPEPLQLALDDLPAHEASGGAPRLVAFGRLRGVGAVSHEHELRFAPEGLTVIYGQNAAGKTTYVRALKRVCRTVDCEAEVRGNVFATPSTPALSPTANVEFVVAGESRAQQLSLADPPDIGLDAISVFDARCAELYMDSQTAIAYVPSALLLLARLAATQDQMRTDLQAEVATFSQQAPTFPEFSAPSAVKTFLDGLSATTDAEAAQRLASLSDEDQSRLTELRAVLASAAARSVRADADASHQDAVQATALVEQLRRLSASLEPSAVEALRGRASEAVSAEEAVELASREFAGLPSVASGRTHGGGSGRRHASSANSPVRPFPPGRTCTVRSVYRSSAQRLPTAWRTSSTTCAVPSASKHDAHANPWISSSSRWMSATSRPAALPS